VLTAADHMAVKITRVNNVSNLKVQSDESVW